LFIAVEQAHYEMVAVLLKLGADRNKTDINDTKIMELASQVLQQVDIENKTD